MIRLANKLGATLNLPSTISFRQVPLVMSVPTAPNAHGDGSVVVGRCRVEPRQFTLSGSIYYPDRQQIRDFADALLQFLQHPPIEVYKWAAPDSRRLYAYPLGAAQDWMDAGAELVVNIPMVAPDPYWYGNETVSHRPASGAWTVDVDGTAPTHPVMTVHVTGSSSSAIVVSGPGGVLQVAGPWQSGDVLHVDTEAFTATLTRGGTTSPAVDRLSNEFVADGFELLPGANTLTYTGPNASVSVTYRPRWY